MEKVINDKDMLATKSSLYRSKILLEQIQKMQTEAQKNTPNQSPHPPLTPVQN